MGLPAARFGISHFNPPYATDAIMSPTHQGASATISKMLSCLFLPIFHLDLEFPETSRTALSWSLDVQLSGTPP
jgi:hypothetical protein